MNYIKNVGDNQNKFGDTATVFQIGLMKDNEVYNFGDNQVTVNIANETGYILSVTPDKSSQNTVLNLDFNKVPLKNLTPDSYRLEVEVKSTDGDIAKFPTSGAMTFSINNDLKETSGELVPTVTFDNVLDAVDEKIAVYMNTVKIGPQGPVGPAGNVDTSKDNTFTGANKFTQPIDGALKTRDATFTDFATVYASMNTYAGNWRVTTGSIVGSPVSGIPYVLTVVNYGVNAGQIILTTLAGKKTYITGVSGGMSTGWILVADDASLVHNTGTETVAGDKTFTGNETFTKGISGWLTQRNVTVNDLNVLNNQNYNGFYPIGDLSVLNLPEQNAGIVEVISLLSGSTAQTYYLLAGPNRGRNYTRVCSAGGVNWSSWKLSADNLNVVHNTGTETINGDKTFLSGNYGLRVTSTGIQKTSDSGTTWVNI